MYRFFLFTKARLQAVEEVLVIGGMRYMKIQTKPNLMTIFLSNKSSEKVTYIDIDKEINFASLKKDVKNGANQFENIIPFLENENRSRVVVISADTREFGYMAITYIMAALNSSEEADDNDWGDFNPYDAEEKDPFKYDGADYFELPFDSDDAGWDISIDWQENKYKIPVIEAGELRAFVSCGSNSYDFGGYMGSMGHSARNNRAPYWTTCKKKPVCIVCDDSEAEYLIGDTLSVFSGNSMVFVLFANRGRGEHSMYEVPFGADENTSLAIKNNLILSNAADEIEVTMEGMYAPSYYEYNFKESLKNRNIKIARGFNVRRVVNLASDMSQTRQCAMIDTIINYALKGYKEKEGMTLKNSDFDFIDRFQRTARKHGQEKATSRLEKELVGIDSIKEQVMDTVNIMKFNKLRASMQIYGGKFHNVHVMLGAPGTAKTTVAQLMGQIMVEEGLLKDNRCICINGAELKGQYVGQSAPKTKALFDNYDVIIIDEAYSIVDNEGTSDSYATEAIAQLIIELERHSSDKLVVFAGYGGRNVEAKDDKMTLFLNANPGIKSRITSTFVFDSYSPDDMVQIFLNIAKVANYRVDENACSYVKKYFECRISDENFGNGREARNLLETSVLFTAKRIMKLGKSSYSADEMKNIATEDVKLAIEKLKQSEKNGTAKPGNRMGFC